ncbi:TetR/AcrR family transcriptional regulator [Amycolatopsis sp. NPDC098790]|uniref:TetR/AcrR family transcriptional regulator n=1 Tax=Amycolatopsis sp. NPDC098790 TaxID=3363939 RepID=UPI00382FE4C7
MTNQDRPHRADSARTMRTILEAAEQVYGANPAATIEQVADAAGVARSTVHRRFATREALLDALSTWANEQFNAAVDAARPETTPPLIGLYQVTANVLRVKRSWAFAMNRAGHTHPGMPSLLSRCDELFGRAREAGLLREDVDPRWATRVYRALIEEVCHPDNDAEDPDALATAVVDTLLRGVGSPSARL